MGPHPSILSSDPVLKGLELLGGMWLWRQQEREREIKVMDS